LLFNVFVADPNVPFRLIKRSCLNEILTNIPVKVFAPNIFMTIYGAKKRVKIININTYCTPGYVPKNNLNSILKGAYRTLAELYKFANDVNS
jgi:hypothetical protein